MVRIVGGDKSSETTEHTHELARLRGTYGWSCVAKHFDFLWVRGQFTVGDEVAEIEDLFSEKRSFLDVKAETKVSKTTENSLERGQGFFDGPSMDENIIHVDAYALAVHVLKYEVHDTLKSRGGINESKRHYYDFVQSVWCAERCILSRAVVHTNVPVTNT